MSYKASCVVLNPQTKKNLQRLAVFRHTSLSAVLNSAGELYLRQYLEEQEKLKLGIQKEE